jgi:opacity protein-like surface antigen
MIKITINSAMTALAMAAALLASPVQADVGVSADIGTTGFGLHLSAPLQENLNARIGVNYLHYSYNGNTSDVDYDFKLKLTSLEALLDWFPTQSQFRISTGLVYNGNKIDATGKSNSTGSYTLNGNTYNASNAGRLDGKVDFRKVAPYLGIGWGNALAKDKGWGFTSDLGVLFQGSPNTSLVNSGCNLPDLPGVSCADLRNDVAAENVKLRDKADSFKFYPVVRVGVSYKF